MLRVRASGGLGHAALQALGRGSSTLPIAAEWPHAASRLPLLRRPNPRSRSANNSLRRASARKRKTSAVAARGAPGGAASGCQSAARRRSMRQRSAGCRPACARNQRCKRATTREAGILAVSCTAGPRSSSLTAGVSQSPLSQAWPKPSAERPGVLWGSRAVTAGCANTILPRSMNSALHSSQCLVTRNFRSTSAAGAAPPRARR
mmetsp:Transcript_23694/g.74536  ORF Transcript_23694/g.74536 Transcript_23694/m.74536 type:complete len:205 (+) Transcript_23694:60-674(+)